MFVGSSSLHGSEEIPSMKSPADAGSSHAASEMTSTCAGKRFFSFKFSGEQRSEMQQFLRAVLEGEYDSLLPVRGEDFRVYPNVVSPSSKTRRAAEEIRSEKIDFTHEQPHMTDSELSDDEFSDDEFIDDNVD